MESHRKGGLMSFKDEKDEKEEYEKLREEYVSSSDPSEKLSEEEAERLSEDLEEIRDNLMDEMHQLHDNLRENLSNLKEERQNLEEELEEELKEVDEEKRELIEEIDELNEELEELDENVRERIDDFKDKYRDHQRKAAREVEKFAEKIQKKVEKAKDKVKRINISVPPEMSEEWKGWAEHLGASVSELVRNSMEFVKENIGNLEKLEEFGKVMDKLGDKIDKSVKESGIEDIGKKIVIHTDRKKESKGISKEQIKKRIEGLIKLQKSLPVSKLAQILNISEEKAENLIYELAAEGIQGELEEGKFKFSSSPEIVTAKIHEMIDNNLI